MMMMAGTGNKALRTHARVVIKAQPKLEKKTMGTHNTPAPPDNVDSACSAYAQTCGERLCAHLLF